MRRATPRFGSVLLVALAVGSFAGAAHAQPVSPAEHDAAARSFGEGMKLIQQGNCPLAIEKLTESLRHEESVGAHLNLADCFERTGAPERAWRSARTAERLALAKRDDARRDTAHLLATNLERSLLKVSFTAPVIEGLEILVDGKALDREALAESLFVVKPGTHKVEASAPGRASETKEVSGAGGEVKSVVLKLEAAAVVAPPVVTPPPTTPITTPPPPDESATRGNGQRTVGLVIGGVGIAGLGVGAVFGIVAMGKSSDLDAQKTDVSREGFDTTKSDAKSAATISTIGVIAGAALAAGGAALFFTAPKSGTQTAARASLVPSFGPQGSGLFLRGQW